MRNRLRSMLALGGLALVALHFVALYIYARPQAHAREKTDYLAGAWVYPWFHQNWNLFAPAPTCNYTLYAITPESPHPRDIFKELILAHRSNRLVGYGPVLIAFSNTIHYFEKNSPLCREVNGPVTDDGYFNMLKRSVRQYLQHKGEQTGNLQIILLIKDEATGEHRLYFDQPG